MKMYFSVRFRILVLQTSLIPYNDVMDVFVLVGSLGTGNNGITIDDFILLFEYI